MNSTSTKLPESLQPYQLLTVNQVTALWGIDRVTLWRWTKRKSDPVPSLKLGKTVKYRLDKILWWLEKQETS